MVKFSKWESPTLKLMLVDLDLRLDHFKVRYSRRDIFEVDIGVYGGLLRSVSIRLSWGSESIIQFILKEKSRYELWRA